ncbi:hypothetical protein FHS54_002621 [Sphingobium vermicomposti]|uniref:Uncharacterized protein n=1 Tax=Sphingobium vermicomposti TaxID=529005 RepID=A0A846M6W2_9SPHN|nr:hypothetical protein [Sphingobium vermicomposti]
MAVLFNGEVGLAFREIFLDEKRFRKTGRARHEKGRRIMPGGLFLFQCVFSGAGA